MAQRRVSPLNGAEGYLRWKESMLLCLHSAGVAHVLSQDPPPLAGRCRTQGVAAAEEAAAAAKKWGHNDAVCRGHILAALTDRLLPDYIRFATGRSLWRAVARTYDVDAPSVAWRRFTDFEFDEDAPLLEQVAHAEALGVAGHSSLSDGVVAAMLCEKLPQDMRRTVKMWSSEDHVTMDTIWKIAQAKEVSRLQMEAGLPVTPSSEDEE